MPKVSRCWIYFFGPLFFGSWLGALAADPPPSAMPMDLTVASTGVYELRFSNDKITLRGKIALKGQELLHGNGADKLGHYEEYRFHAKNSAVPDYSIRLYRERQSLVFEESGGNKKANAYHFPEFEALPQGFHAASFQHSAFHPIHFDLKGDAPWAFFNAHRNTFILSPLNHFIIANNFKSTAGSISVGIEPQVNEHTKDFKFRSVLTFGNGVNSTYDAWGKLLMKEGGKSQPDNDRGVVLNKIGYWTDNQSSYWYNYNRVMGYAGTLENMAREMTLNGVQPGYVQLDEWWYPKGNEPPTWQKQFLKGQSGFEAPTDLFPGGVKAFQHNIGLPLVSHGRWYDPEGKFHSFRFSDQAPIDPRFWEMAMETLADFGDKVYEQDWLAPAHDDVDANGKVTHVGSALPRLDRINDGELYFGEMAKAAARHGMDLQYCMQLPRVLLQGSRYGNVTTARVSGDGFELANRRQFLFNSRLASALGMWPWTDVVTSQDRGLLLLSALSAGPVGIGDRLKRDDDPDQDYEPNYVKQCYSCQPLNVGNLRLVARADGVIVKPDVPLLPLDRSYIEQAADPENTQTPMVSAAFTAGGNQPRAAYLYAFGAKNGPESKVLVDPAKDLGFTGPVVAVANPQTEMQPAVPQLVRPGEKFAFAASYQGNYRIMVPVSSSGLAILGDLDKFVSLGKKRIPSVSPDGTVSTVRFAPGENILNLSGVSTTGRSPLVVGASGRLVSFDPQTGIFKVEVHRPTGALNAELDAEIHLKPQKGDTPDTEIRTVINGQ